MLVGLPSGNVLALPRPLFNARRCDRWPWVRTCVAGWWPADSLAGMCFRPTTPQAAERAVGLPKYSPLLPISPQAFINYNQVLRPTPGLWQADERGVELTPCLSAEPRATAGD